MNTIEQLAACTPGPSEILVIDQTEQHEASTTAALHRFADGGVIRWICLTAPSITGAMNLGLAEATGDVVLFLDDDIVPSRGLFSSHAAAHEEEGVLAVVGQVLQPGEVPTPAGLFDRGAGLTEDLRFPFNSTERCFVSNVMAGNLSVRREAAIAVGGFDQNFVGSAYRFETEFARRLLRSGGMVLYEPAAGIRHLRAPSGGTRAFGSHLTSGSPLHGAGDYYFALTHGLTTQSLAYLVRRPLREVRTRFHLLHPWWIPVKVIGELRALALAIRLWNRGPSYMTGVTGDRSRRSGLPAGEGGCAE